MHKFRNKQIKNKKERKKNLAHTHLNKHITLSRNEKLCLLTEVTQASSTQRQNRQQCGCQATIFRPRRKGIAVRAGLRQFSSFDTTSCRARHFFLLVFKMIERIMNTQNLLFSALNPIICYLQITNKFHSPSYQFLQMNNQKRKPVDISKTTM